MKKPHLGRSPKLLFLFLTSSLFLAAYTQSSSSDASVMQGLKLALNPPSSLGWTGSDPCSWTYVQCSKDNRVTRVQIGNQQLTGTLPPNLNNLTALQVFEVQNNQLTGSLPSFSGLSSLQSIILSHNGFTFMPPDFFNGMSSLQYVTLDYNPFAAWSIPDGLQAATALQNFSATNTSITGTIPDFFGGNTFPGLVELRLSFNYLSGGVPASFSGSSIQSLWLNGQQGTSKLSSNADVLSNMTQLTDVSLQGNSFTGPLPDLSGLTQLKRFNIRENSFTGPVPASLLGLPSLEVVNMTNNLLQGPYPVFKPSVSVDMIASANSFCLPNPGSPCDKRVTTLLAIAESVGYPAGFASSWKGDDPCGGQWPGISCFNGSITAINFNQKSLTGTISPNFSSIPSLAKLILSNNNFTGTIPDDLTTLPELVLLDVSYNQLSGAIPPFNSSVTVKTDGNIGIEKDTPVPPAATHASPLGGTPGSPSADQPRGGSGSSTGGGFPSTGKSSSTGVVVGSVVGGVCVIFLAGVLVFCLRRAKRKRSGGSHGATNTMVIHPRHSGSDNDMVKITIAGSSTNVGANSETYSRVSSNPGDLHIVEAGNMVISIQVLKNVTNNFSADNVLGKGGFGTVYKGELHDGTKIAVKRMESGMMTEKGLDEFKSEITVLTKVRHRHLVALLGYCLDGNERLLVYEYMPQGTLSRYLFNWKEEGLKPLEWTKRLTLALDVARGVEYLHGLAQQSFIHRDLKPSNILLGDDMRAKVADFGLVRLAPDGKASVVTRLAGTFGYLAPEYAVTGRVTTKIDVYSFGVILMELITGRRALDEAQPEESTHLVPWFRRMLLNKETFRKAIDPILTVDEESVATIATVAELAGHCCAREPQQRPDMSHVVNALSSLAELWKPSEPDPDDIYGIDLDMTLPQAMKKWQALEGAGAGGFDISSTASSSLVGSNDNTQTSIPTRPSGFADSFTSADGR